MATAETLGQRIQRLRLAAGLSQSQLAREADIPIGTIKNWEQDVREPMALVVVRLARAMGVEPNDILLNLAEPVEEPPPPPRPTPTRTRKKKGET